MTNPTPHGQVPEALIDLIDAYAETRHRYGGIYNAKTEAARNAVIEALSGVQALSAAPAVPAGACGYFSFSDECGFDRHDTADAAKAAATEMLADIRRELGGEEWPMNVESICWGVVVERAAEHETTTREDGEKYCDYVLKGASPTPPAEQQATKETSGGFHVWRDISTAPKDGSRFVATGHNYGLYGEVRHTCVAQWFRGCWMEASDWNETSELKYLTHWMPLPSPPDDVAAPAEQQAAPKAAPVEQDDHQILAITTAYEQGVGKGHQAYNSGKEIANPYSPAYRCDLAWQYGYKEGKEQAQREAKAAPQQEVPAVPIEIERAIRAAGLTLVKTTNGYSLLKLGKIEAQVEQPSCLQVKRDEWDALPLGAQRLLIAATKAAPQQEAKEPVMIYHGRCTIDCGEHGHHDMEMLRMIPSGSKLYTAPQPAPAELERLRERIARMGLDVDRAMRGHVNEQSPLGTQRLAAIAALVKPKPAPPSDDVVKDAARYRWLREGNDAKHGAAWHVAVNLYGCEWDAAIDAAIAAQGGKV